MDDVLAALDKHGAGAGEDAMARGYRSERRHWMRYGEYRSHGLPIGFGAGRGGLRNGGGRRTKCIGMGWTVAGANPVLWVRFARLSSWFDDYWICRTPV